VGKQNNTKNPPPPKAQFLPRKRTFAEAVPSKKEEKGGAHHGKEREEGVAMMGRG